MNFAGYKRGPVNTEEAPGLPKHQECCFVDAREIVRSQHLVIKIQLLLKKRFFKLILPF
jgi:hypothetical protein